MTENAPASKAIDTNQAGKKIADILAPPAPAAKAPAAAESEKKKRPVLSAKPNPAPAQDSLADILQGKGPKDAAKAQPTKAQSLDDVPSDSLEGNDEANQADTLDASDEANEDAEQTDPSEDGDDADSDDLEFREVVIDGKTEKISIKELVSGYQRDADYRKKTTELAAKRKELLTIEEQIKDLPEARNRYVKQAERFERNADLVMLALEKAFMPQPPDLELAKTNPSEYILQKERHQEALQVMDSLVREKQKFQEAETADHQKKLQVRNKVLYQALPELNDATQRAKLTQYLRGAGITDDLIMSETNATLFIHAHKAMKYDELMSKKGTIAKYNSKPRIAKNTQAPEGQKEALVRKRSEVFSRHEKDKSVNSAIAAIKALTQ
jgi:hypothetical protein